VKSAWTTVLGYGREAGRWAGLVQNGGKGAESEAVERKEVVPVAVDNQPGVMGRLFGSFTSLSTSDGSGTKSKAATRGLPPPGTYKIGEVRAEYVKVSGHVLTEQANHTD